jgi:hypothetical protein
MHGPDAIRPVISEYPFEQGVVKNQVPKKRRMGGLIASLSLLIGSIVYMIGNTAQASPVIEFMLDQKWEIGTIIAILFFSALLAFFRLGHVAAGLITCSGFAALWHSFSGDVAIHGIDLGYRWVPVMCSTTALATYIFNRKRDEKSSLWNLAGWLALINGLAFFACVVILGVLSNSAPIERIKITTLSPEQVEDLARQIDPDQVLEDLDSCTWNGGRTVCIPSRKSADPMQEPPTVNEQN